MGVLLRQSQECRDGQGRTGERGRYLDVGHDLRRYQTRDVLAVGGRDGGYAFEFIEDLKARLASRVHGHAVALHFMCNKLGRIHKTRRITTAMATAVSDHVWSLEEIAALVS